MPELLLTVNGVDLTNKVLWEQCRFEMQAEEGQVANGTLVLRDTVAAIAPLFNQEVLLYDHGQLAFRGYVGPEELGRDDDVDHYGARRVWRVTIVDTNVLFDQRRAETFDRASESDRTRVIAAFAAYRPTINASTYVTNYANVTMDAFKYTDQMLRDVVADCAEAAGKDYWIDRSLYLHYADTGSQSSNVSTLVLTDTVASYAKDILVQPFPTTYNIGLIRRRDDPYSVPLQNSLLLKYGQTDPPSTVTVSRSDSIAVHGVIEGNPVYDQRATSAANATARAVALLARAKFPERSYETEIGLPRLDIIQAGVYVTCTSVHQSLNAAVLKVTSLVAERVGGSSGTGYWKVTLQLSAPVRSAPRTKGYGILRPYLPRQCIPPTAEFLGVLTQGITPNLTKYYFPSTPGTGLLMCVIKSRAVAFSATKPMSDGWRQVQMNQHAVLGGTAGLAIYVLDGDGTQSYIDLDIDNGMGGYVYYFPDATANMVSGSTPVYNTGYTFACGAVAVPTNSLVFGFFNQYQDSRGGGAWHYTLGNASSFDFQQTQAWSEFGPYLVGVRSSSATPSVTVVEDVAPAWTTGPPAWDAISITVDGSARCVDPVTGQRIENETSPTTPDGTTTTFATEFPYADGSLRVYVDGTEQTGAVSSFDGASGEFTLSFAPLADEQVRVWYLGR